MREACRQLRVWLDAGLAPVPLSVNISAVEFTSRDFVTSVRSILRETGVSPEYLELELSERVLMQHADSTVSALKALKDVGVRLSMDDFGMGASSLSHLAPFPIDSLKMDQSFGHEVSSRSDGAVSVPLDVLIGADCEAGQGYYLEQPMPAEEFCALLQAGTSDV